MWISLRVTAFVRSVVYWLAVLAAWAVFVVWWHEVLQTTRLWVVGFLVAEILLAAIVLVVATYVWIKHNKAIARKGRRGNSNRYRVPRFDHDVLRRPLILPLPEVLRSAPVIEVNVLRSGKSYTACPLRATA